MLGQAAETRQEIGHTLVGGLDAQVETIPFADLERLWLKVVGEQRDNVVKRLRVRIRGTAEIVQQRVNTSANSWQ